MTPDQESKIDAIISCLRSDAEQLKALQCQFATATKQALETHANLGIALLAYKLDGMQQQIDRLCSRVDRAKSFYSELETRIAAIEKPKAST